MRGLLKPGQLGRTLVDDANGRALMGVRPAQSSRPVKVPIGGLDRDTLVK